MIVSFFLCCNYILGFIEKLFGKNSPPQKSIKSYSYKFLDADFDPEAVCDAKGVQFFPRLYFQRYKAVADVLRRHKKNGSIKKIVDFGCAELSFFLFAKRLEGVEEYVGVDIDHGSLQRHYCKAVPLNTDYLVRRISPLKVHILNGNIAHPDERLKNTNAVVAIELIEHLYPPDLDDVPYNIFGVIQPEIAIITTPNADFNVLFTNLVRFRNEDHKFEWTREEFQDWADNVITRYPSYEVTFYGIGPGPEGFQDVGCCSQMAVFVRREQVELSNDFRDFYISVYETEYPFQTAEEKLNDNLVYEIQRFIDYNAGNEDFMIDDHLEIPFDEIFKNIKVDCTSEKLKEYLEKEGKKVEYRNNKSVLILPLYLFEEDTYNSSEEGDDLPSVLVDVVEENWDLPWDESVGNEDMNPSTAPKCDNMVELIDEASSTIDEVVKSDIASNYPNTPKEDSEPCVLNTIYLGSLETVSSEMLLLPPEEAPREKLNDHSKVINSDKSFKTKSDPLILKRDVDTSPTCSDSTKCSSVEEISKMSQASGEKSETHDKLTYRECHGNSRSTCGKIILIDSNLHPEEDLLIGDSSDNEHNSLGSYTPKRQTSMADIHEAGTSEINTTNECIPQISDMFPEDINYNGYQRIQSKKKNGVSSTCGDVERNVDLQASGPSREGKKDKVSLSTEKEKHKHQQKDKLYKSEERSDASTKGSESSKQVSSTSMYRCHSLENVNNSKNKNFRYSLNIVDNEEHGCDTSVVDMQIDSPFKRSSVPSLTDTFGSHSRAVDSGYPNSLNQDMDMDLTPEQVDEIITETESSVEEEEESSIDEIIEPVQGNAPVIFLDNVENGDVANNNRDGEGNNMEGGEVLEEDLLDFEGLVLGGEEEEAAGQHESDDEGLYLSAIDASNDTLVPEEVSSNDDLTQFNSLYNASAFSLTHSINRGSDESIERLPSSSSHGGEHSAFFFPDEDFDFPSWLLNMFPEDDIQASGDAGQDSLSREIIQLNETLPVVDREEQVEIIVPGDDMGGGEPPPD